MNVYDVTEKNFEELVVEESKKRPVVIDFWSPMCGPCQVLGPILERVVESYAGKAALAKVKVDDCPQLAGTFGVQGVPTVKVVRDGRIVSEFVGARSEREVRAALDAVVPSEADELTRKASAHAKSGRWREAEVLYRQALAKKPDHDEATLGLAYVEVERGNRDEARRLAGTVEPGTRTKPLADALLSQLDFSTRCAAAGDLSAMENRVRNEPLDLDARFEFAECLAAAGEYRKALINLMVILEHTKAYKGGVAKETMLKIFGIVGKRSELAEEFRGRMASILY